MLGRDLVGIVAAVGTAGVGFSPGDRVWANSLGHGVRKGSFADYAGVPVDRRYHLPAGVDPERAVAVAHPAATAYLGLFRHARLHVGETIYLGGGAGNVGTAAIELAAAGARVVASARKEDFAHCRRAGAHATIDYRDPELAGPIRPDRALGGNPGMAGTACWFPVHQ